MTIIVRVIFCLLFLITNAVITFEILVKLDIQNRSRKVEKNTRKTKKRSSKSIDNFLSLSDLKITFNERIRL